MTTDSVRIVRAADGTNLARDGIRRLILSRQLYPGQQLRQAELAQLLNISRSPIREALQGLLSEGLVDHHPNRGYFVTRLSGDMLKQIFLMRRLLETEVLGDCAWPKPATIRKLRGINARIAAAAERHQVADFVLINREFHFEIFRLSGLNFVLEELDRLWAMADPYRSLYLWDKDAQAQTLSDHEQLIDALERQDRADLIAASDRHRAAAEYKLLALLSEPAAAGLAGVAS